MTPHQLTHWLHVDPERARDKLRALMAESTGPDDAAQRIGTSRRTLYRWLRQLGLEPNWGRNHG